MARRGRRLSLYGRLAALERDVAPCRACAEAKRLRVRLEQNERGSFVIVSFGDDRPFCPECGSVWDHGVRRAAGDDDGDAALPSEPDPR